MRAWLRASLLSLHVGLSLSGPNIDIVCIKTTPPIWVIEGNCGETRGKSLNPGLKVFVQ
jgi:hypothetical protein